MNRPLKSTSDGVVLKGTPQLLLVGEIPMAESIGMRARLVRGGNAFHLPSRPDLAIVRAADVGPGEMALLAAPICRDMPVIVIADAQSADAAGALMALEVVAFLDPDCSADEIETLVREQLSRTDPEVAETSRPLDPRLEAIRQEVERMTAAIAAMARGSDLIEAPPISAARIRAHIKARRLRETFFPAGLFADPAWDILLDLGAARREGRPVSVSSLCIAAAVPTTTALRWIKTMVDGGLLVRRADSADARRAFIELAPVTSETLDRCLEATFNLPGL